LNGLRKWLAISLTFSIISILALLFYTITPDQLRSPYTNSPGLLGRRIDLSVRFVARLGRPNEDHGRSGRGRALVRNRSRSSCQIFFAAAITPGHAGGKLPESAVARLQAVRGDASAVVLGERMLDALFLGIAAPIAFSAVTRYVQTTPGIIALFRGRGHSFRLTLFLPALRYGKAKKSEVCGDKSTLAVRQSERR